jgi:hypothetical protein
MSTRTSGFLHFGYRFRPANPAGNVVETARPQRPVPDHVRQDSSRDYFLFVIDNYW